VLSEKKSRADHASFKNSRVREKKNNKGPLLGFPPTSSVKATPRREKKRSRKIVGGVKGAQERKKTAKGTIPLKRKDGPRYTVSMGKKGVLDIYGGLEKKNLRGGHEKGGRKKRKA